MAKESNMEVTPSSHSLSNFYVENIRKNQQEVEGMAGKGIKIAAGDDYDVESIDDENAYCMTCHTRQTSKKDKGLSWRKYGLWRQAQKTRVARLEKQLKVRWNFEELIEMQLNRYRAHYNHAMIPTMLKDAAQLLMPKQAPPAELVAVAWLGDWRPSAILDLLHGLACSFSSLLSTSRSNSNEIERLLSQLIHEIRIEEAVIDGEMAELQATCVLHLPFAPINSNQSDAAKLSFIQAEFKKIESVITKANQLRFKALELAVKKLLTPVDAAEFLVAFTGIQDLIHLFAAKRKLPKGPVIVPAMTLGFS